MRQDIKEATVIVARVIKKDEVERRRQEQRRRLLSAMKELIWEYPKEALEWAREANRAG